MIERMENGVAYTQVFDAENRLISVTANGQTTRFLYDADGNLVQKIKPDGNRTLYVGTVYEVDKDSSGTVTRTVTYYPAGGAMRIQTNASNHVYYVLKDHLGSASVVMGENGLPITNGAQRYEPFGEARLSPSNMLTDKLFTGQREMADLRIYHYGARFYSPYINRFLSADTIVPDYANPQSLNRYSYVVNNPLRYTDPTGHMMKLDSGGGKLENSLKYFEKYGKHKGKFNEVYAAVYEAELALANVLSDGKLSEGEALELKTYEDEIQQYRDKALKNLGQDEFADLENFPSSSNLLKRVTDRAEIVDGFVVSSQIPSEPDMLGDSAAIAGVVVVFGHGARHLKGLPVTQAEVEAAISRSVELNVSPASTGLHKGYVTVNGIEFEYHAYPLGNNTINIGTYYPEKK